MLVIDGIAILRDPDSPPADAPTLIGAVVPLIAGASFAAPNLPLWSRAFVGAATAATVIVAFGAHERREPVQHFWTGRGSYAQRKHDAIAEAFDLGLDAVNA